MGLIIGSIIFVAIYSAAKKVTKIYNKKRDELKNKGKSSP
jgi:hypothetical protein